MIFPHRVFLKAFLALFSFFCGIFYCAECTDNLPYVLLKDSLLSYTDLDADFINYCDTSGFDGLLSRIITIDGKEYLLKSADTENSHHFLINESQVDAIYKSVAVNVPDFTLYIPSNLCKQYLKIGTSDSKYVVCFKDGSSNTMTIYKLSVYHKKGVSDFEKPNAYEVLKENAAVDALLGNYDVLGQNFEKIRMIERNQFVRACNHGAMQFTSNGKLRKTLFNVVPYELFLYQMTEKDIDTSGDFADEVWTPSISEIYLNLAWDDILNQIRSIVVNYDKLKNSLFVKNVEDLMDFRVKYFNYILALEDTIMTIPNTDDASTSLRIPCIRGIIEILWYDRAMTKGWNYRIPFGKVNGINLVVEGFTTDSSSDAVCSDLIDVVYPPHFTNDKECVAHVNDFKEFVLSKLGAGEAHGIEADFNLAAGLNQYCKVDKPLNMFAADCEENLTSRVNSLTGQGPSLIVSDDAEERKHHCTNPFLLPLSDRELIRRLGSKFQDRSDVILREDLTHRVSWPAPVLWRGYKSLDAQTTKLVWENGAYNLKYSGTGGATISPAGARAMWHDEFKEMVNEEISENTDLNTNNNKSNALYKSLCRVISKHKSNGHASSGLLSFSTNSKYAETFVYAPDPNTTPKAQYGMLVGIVPPKDYLTVRSGDVNSRFCGTTSNVRKNLHAMRCTDDTKEVYDSEAEVLIGGGYDESTVVYRILVGGTTHNLNIKEDIYGRIQEKNNVRPSSKGVSLRRNMLSQIKGLNKSENKMSETKAATRSNRIRNGNTNDKLRRKSI